MSDVVKVETAFVVCKSVMENCICDLPVSHEGPHECGARDTCGGSWGTQGGQFRVAAWPIIGRSFMPLPPNWDWEIAADASN